MQRYSDAAMLKGDYAHMVAQLRSGERSVPSPDEWQQTSCDNAAEAAAQAVAKQIFELQSTLDENNEQLEITAISVAGIMVVVGLFPGDGDLIRIEGNLLTSKEPVAQIIHANQLELTVKKRPTADSAPEEDATRIGFVIFDQLTEHSKSKTGPKRKATPEAKSKKSQPPKTKAPRR